LAYVANAASGDLSSYRIDGRGTLELVNPTAAVIAMGKPLDTKLSDGDRFLYTLDASNHVIQAFRVANEGSLVALGPQSGALPSSAVGLAAR
jgi:6-phosphogluconolactonase (cycloisomerase 2 family)